jgi:endonuclease/exonuclease/phosphatase family metal-dependent hydrolase
MKLRTKHLGWLALFPLGNACHTAKLAERAGSDTLHVMTYNIRHANPPSKTRDSTIDLRAIAKVINQEKPDLVALQEVDVNNSRAGMNLNEARALATLTRMYYYFTPAMDYRGGEYGDAVLSRFPILDSFSFHLPKIDGTKKEEMRSLCMIKIRIPRLGETLFASTHLGLSEPTRLLQAYKLNAIIGTFSLPVIIGGDFNATPESSPIRIMDSLMTRSCTSNCDLTIPAKHPRTKIDYILYRPADKFRVIREKTIAETYASDHLPVLAIFTF